MGLMAGSASLAPVFMRRMGILKWNVRASIRHQPD